MTENSEEVGGELEAPLTRKKDLPDKAEAILLCVTRGGSVVKKDLKNELGIGYQLLKYHVDQLREKHLIREAGTREMKRGPRRDTYEPTVAGLLYSYSERPDDPRIRKEGEKRIPLVLGKREHFEKHEIDHIILPSFEDFSRGRWGYYAYELSKKRSEEDGEGEIVKELTKDFYRELLHFGSFRSFLWRRATRTRDEEVARIGRALVADKELTELTQPIISNLREWYGGLATVYEEIEKAMGGE